MITRTLLSLLLAFQTPIMGTGHRSVLLHGIQGPFTPGTAVGWTNFNNAKACDGAYATAVVHEGAVGPSLSSTNFGFSIPSTAVIAGISVSVLHLDITGNAQIQDNTVRLIKGGVGSGNNKASAALWSGTVPETFNYGSATDLWGLAWSPSDINASNFGVQVNVKNTDLVDGDSTVGIDCVRITVAY